jgi:hypothetical protein
MTKSQKYINNECRYLIRCHRELTAAGNTVLRRLMKNKTYNSNGTNKPYKVLLRTFIPANWRGHPDVLLLCQLNKPDELDRFSFVIFSDGLYGKGHYPSDTFGFGDMKYARLFFRDMIIHNVAGVQNCDFKEIVKEAKRISQLERKTK